MATLNIRATPKSYPQLYSEDESIPLSQLSKVPTTQIKPSGYFNENIADRSYNEAMELEFGDVFSIRVTNPILRWHPAKKDTATRFQGHLSKIFPELRKISDKALDTLIKDMRNREE